MSNKLLEKIKKNSTIKDAAVLSQSRFFKDVEMIPTPIPAINIALSGQIDGGLSSGVTMWAGPSKHFKSNFSLAMVAAYMKRYEDSVCLFYDSEFGSPLTYFESFKIDMDRVHHAPLKNIEELKFDIVKQLEEIERGDRLIIFIDSVGNLASKKEVDDALSENTAADMTRARQLKSLFRMVTPYLNLKDIPLVVVNHTYKEMCLNGFTKIKTTDGIKYIKDICIGDFVYTNNGIQKVLKTFKPEELDTTGKEFLELEFDDGTKVLCTDNHKFLMNDGKWVPAGLLNIGDEFKTMK